MIFSTPVAPTLEEVQEMLYWYGFTSKDVLTHYHIGEYQLAKKIATDMRSQCRREHRLHGQKDTLLLYRESEIFLAYARAIDEIRKAVPLILTLSNLETFARKTQEISDLFLELIRSHSPEDLTPLTI